MRLSLAMIALLACACHDDGGRPLLIVDAAPPDALVCARTRTSVCNPLTQSGCAAGEKCTWWVDAAMPYYVGHVGCAPDGNAAVGESCMYGPPGCDGYDNCQRGLVCGDYRGGVGECKQLCDQQGGNPICDATHACVTYPGLFSTGDTTPPAAGVCDVACDPLAANDFDGSGSSSLKTSMVCGSDATTGCYGYPSFGTSPRTEFSCRPDLHADVAQPVGLRHRVECTVTNACAELGPTIYVNSCNQGYLPLLQESSMVSTAICVALCKPKNCYAGNCGSNDEDRLGEAPHRCMEPDRVGSFDTSANGEHCTFLWYFERDQQGTFLRSPSSDTLGFCYDHSKYLHDSNGDGIADAPLPPCASLPDGFATSSPYDGAADLGCVDTTHAMLLQGKASPPPAAFDGLRPLVTRTPISR